MKTFMAKPEDMKNRKWYILDTEAAKILRGKHKPDFTPHVDTGDHVIVINAEKAILTGNKLKNKKYYRHSGYPGGLKTVSYETLMSTRPDLAMEKAIKGM